MAARRSIFIALLIALGGCRACRDWHSPAAPPTPRASAPPPAPVAEANESPAPAPEIAASVHGSAAVELAPGWGWIIDATALNPDAFQARAKTMQLIGSGAGWTSAFSVQLKRADGTAVPLNAVLTGEPPSTATLPLDRETVARARWLVTPQDTQLPPGKYQLVVAAEAPAAADAGWSGRTESPPVRITIVAPPSPATPAWEERERLIKAHYAEATGDGVGARAEIDALLASQPENVSALTVKGNLQEAANDKAGALKTYDQALSILEKRGLDALEPPVYLLHRRRDLALSLGNK